MSRSLAEIIDNRWAERYAIEEVRANYGDLISFSEKKKKLNKHGRTENADADTPTTIATFQADTVIHETFATGNTIDSIVSASAGDTMDIIVEGHTIDAAGNLHFSVQTATLTGQTPALLGTPLARASRMKDAQTGTFLSPVGAAPAGPVYVYDSAAAGGVTLGVPNTAAATKCVMPAGYTHSEKCATSVSADDYWLINMVRLGGGKGNAGTMSAQGLVEVRTDGGPWTSLGIEPVIRSGGSQEAVLYYEPYLIVPRNSDVRFVVESNTADAVVAGAIYGTLAKIMR